MAVRTKPGFFRSWRTIHRVSSTQATAMRQTSQKRIGSPIRPICHLPSLFLVGVRPQATRNSSTPPAYQRTPRMQSMSRRSRAVAVARHMSSTGI